MLKLTGIWLDIYLAISDRGTPKQPQRFLRHFILRGLIDEVQVFL